MFFFNRIFAIFDLFLIKAELKRRHFLELLKILFLFQLFLDTVLEIFSNIEQFLVRVSL